jgi:hypothetical protein
MVANRLLKFAGDPKTYHVNNTISAVVTYWMSDRITEEAMLVYLHQFKKIYDSGVSSVPFMKDLDVDTMLETSLWFLKYGLGRQEGN